MGGKAAISDKDGIFRQGIVQFLAHSCHVDGPFVGRQALLHLKTPIGHAGSHLSSKFTPRLVLRLRAIGHLVDQVFQTRLDVTPKGYFRRHAAADFLSMNF